MSNGSIPWSQVMRFFQGNRNGSDNSRKKGLAGAMYKQMMLGKAPKKAPTRDEQYKKMVEGKIDGLMNELAEGKRKGFRLPGTKETEKKEVSKNFKDMLQKLAMKKLQKEMDQKKRKEREQMWKEKADKKAKEAALKAEELKKKAPAYFFGVTEEKKDSFFGVGITPEEKKDSWW
jgi:hypothetical protein